VFIKNEIFKIPMGVLDSIDINKINWDWLSKNPNAIYILEKYR
jgi:hypothetical protein